MKLFCLFFVTSWCWLPGYVWSCQFTDWNDSQWSLYYRRPGTKLSIWSSFIRWGIMVPRVLRRMVTWQFILLRSISLISNINPFNMIHHHGICIDRSEEPLRDPATRGHNRIESVLQHTVSGEQSGQTDITTPPMQFVSPAQLSNWIVITHHSIRAWKSCEVER
jgi:hypothetical protein